MFATIGIQFLFCIIINKFVEKKPSFTYLIFHENIVTMTHCVPKSINHFDVDRTSSEKKSDSKDILILSFIYN